MEGMGRQDCWKDPEQILLLNCHTHFPKAHRSIVQLTWLLSTDLLREGQLYCKEDCKWRLLNHSLLPSPE